MKGLDAVFKINYDCVQSSSVQWHCIVLPQNKPFTGSDVSKVLAIVFRLRRFVVVVVVAFLVLMILIFIVLVVAVTMIIIIIIIIFCIFFF